MAEDYDDLILAVRRRRTDAIAQHAAELALLDGIEAMLFQAATLREPPPEPEPVAEITWTEVWQNHPAAADFFAQFPDGFPEDRMMQS